MTIHSGCLLILKILAFEIPPQNTVIWNLTGSPGLSFGWANGVMAVSYPVIKLN